MFRAPVNVLVYGPSRPLVNLAVYAIASEANPEFHWVEIASKQEPRMSCDPVRMGWVPERRLWVVDGLEALRPDETHGKLSLNSVIRSDEPAESLQQFIDFLRLPDRSQQIISSQVPDGHPGVVAVTNVHRARSVVATHLVPSILSAHQNAGFSVIVGSGGSPGSARDLFEYVFRLQGRDRFARDWRTVEMVCEKGITSGPLRDSQPVVLAEIPLLADVISRALPS
ncbi:MAG TPA: hypothetical protein VEG42_01760 [Thermoplasmata archaeon]|nr:hypothetical protein [Thermoplasmata archaeon]